MQVLDSGQSEFARHPTTHILLRQTWPRKQSLSTLQVTEKNQWLQCYYFIRKIFRGFLTFSIRQRILMSRKIIQSGCQNWGMNSVLCDQLLGAVKKSNRHSFILCYLFRRKEFNWDINRDNNIIIILLSVLRYLSVLDKEICLWDSLYKMSNVKNGELIIKNYNLHMQRPWRHRSLKAQFRSDWMNARALIKVLLFKARCTIKHQISFRYTACLWIYG